eukprot:g3161.t1
MEGLQTVFRDGQAAVLWFAGMHTGNWVKKLTGPEEDKMRRDFVEHPEESLRKAVHAFHDYLWVGIRGVDWEEMKEMLLFQGNFASYPTESHANKNRHHDEVSDDEIETLKRMVPVDMAFYEYAVAVNKVRIEAYRDMAADRARYDAWCSDPKNWDTSWQRLPLWYNEEQIL